jgi:hypothetical protein
MVLWVYPIVKTPCFILLALLLVGCASTKPGASLTVEQATRIARQLANDKAAALYHWQPFLGSQTARLVANQWVWTEHQGFGYGDIQADVELAPDGTPKKVEIQILDSRNILPYYRGF